MKENKEILLTFYPKDKCPIPIAFSVSFTMNFPEDMSSKECWKEWQEVVEILKHLTVRRARK